MFGNINGNYVRIVHVEHSYSDLTPCDLVPDVGTVWRWTRLRSEVLQCKE